MTKKVGEKLYFESKRNVFLFVISIDIIVILFYINLYSFGIATIFYIGTIFFLILINSIAFLYPVSHLTISESTLLYSCGKNRWSTPLSDIDGVYYQTVENPRSFNSKKHIFIETKVNKTALIDLDMIKQHPSASDSLVEVLQKITKKPVVEKDFYG